MSSAVKLGGRSSSWAGADWELGTRFGGFGARLKKCEGIGFYFFLLGEGG